MKNNSFESRDEERPTTVPSLQSKAPQQGAQEVKLDNCPLCNEPIQVGDPRVHLKAPDETNYTPAHTSCQDKITAAKRAKEASNPKKFLG